MLKPQDIMIGDYLLADGKVIRVAAIHQKKVGYHNVPNKLTWVRLDRLDYIRITPETLTAFGFVKTEQACFCESWEFRYEKQTLEEDRLFVRRWLVNDDGERACLVSCRYYSKYVGLPHDAISEMQHFFYEFTHGNVMPIKYQSNK